MGLLAMGLNTYVVRCGGVEQSCVGARIQRAALGADRKRAAVVSGELMNTAAYAFAPAVLVTPLGALSVLIG